METCWDGAFDRGAEGDPVFGRGSHNDVVLTNRLRKTLLKLNLRYFILSIVGGNK